MFSYCCIFAVTVVVVVVNRYCATSANYQRNCAGFIVPGHPIQSYPTTEMTIDQILTVH